MKILRIFLILCSLFLLLNASSKYEYKHSYKNLDYLNLNFSQVKSIKNILLELKDEYKEFYKFKEKIEEDLEDIIKDSKFNEKLYYEKVMEIKKRATFLETKRIKMILEILNEKQKNEFSEHFKEWIIE